MEKLHHLHGMRDLPQKSWLSLNAARDRLRELFSFHGYQVLETPLLEPTELFLRKSGGDLAARMYTFTDPGGNQVSLRPEYTASIIRHYLEKDSAERLPVRVQYAGPVFRYEGSVLNGAEWNNSIYHQFTQVGAELLGALDPRADAEILSLSCMTLSILGLSGHRLEIGDLGVLHQLLESLGLSERAIVFILSSMADLKEGQEGFDRVWERARQLRLLASDSRQSHLSTAITGMEEAEARELLHGLLEWAEVGSLGQRDSSEVVERLLRKLVGTDDPARLRRGLEVAYGLAGIKGEPNRCLSEAGNLIESWDLNPSVLDRLKQIMGFLEVDQLRNATVVLDFGLARGLAYYTGIVFEIKHPALETSLGGGGRYDGLAKALGSPSNIPALGFAYTLEHLLAALGREGKSLEGCEVTADDVLMLAPEGEAYSEALRLARELRGRGTRVEMEVCGWSVEESLSYARAKGFAEVIAVGNDGKSTTYRIQGSPTRSARPELS